MNKTSFILFLSLIILSSEGWLPEVTQYNQNDSNNGYAGVFGKPISCIRVSGSKRYRVHVKGGNWLPAVTGNSAYDPNNGYAGIEGKVIDAISIEGATYKVHFLGGSWSKEKTGYDTTSGYAGTFGKSIDAIMVKGRTYAVYYENIDTPEIDIDPDPGSGTGTGTGTGGSSKCVFTNSGTGIQSIALSRQIPHMQEGCLFMASCVKGGLCTTAEISKAYTWAVSAGKIRAEDTYVFNTAQLPLDISQKYGTTYHPEYQVQHNSGYTHYWLTYNGKEIFNSAGLGWHDYS